MNLHTMGIPYYYPLDHPDKDNCIHTVTDELAQPIVYEVKKDSPNCQAREQWAGTHGMAAVHNHWVC